MFGTTFTSVKMTLETISSLHDAWEDLAHNAIEKNAFLFPWFARASLELMYPKKPIIVTIYKDDLLIGLTIMQPDKGFAKIPVGFYRTCLQYHQFLATPLIRDGYAEDFFAGLGKWLDASPKSRSLCILSLLPGDGEIAEAVNATFKSERRPLLLLEEFDRPAIFGPRPSEEAAFEHISKSRLKNLKRRQKNLSKLGKITIDEFSESDRAEEWLDGFIRLEDSGWKHDEKTSIAENPIDLEFYRQMTSAAHAKNNLTFLRLSIDGVPIAYTLDLIQDSFVYCMKCAHDAEYRKYAPGILLEYETLKKYSKPDMPVYVDSCTSPKNEMIRDLWPDTRKITTIAFSKNTLLHQQIFKSVFFVKHLTMKNTVWTKEKHK